MRHDFPDLVRRCYQANKLWPNSYFAGSVGRALLSVLRQYRYKQRSIARIS